MKRSTRILQVAAILTSVSVLLMGGAPAVAQPAAARDSLTETSVPMTVSHFDHEVARANGFEIRTDETGNEYSVPVTEVARRMIETSEGDMSALGTVRGNCGTSTLLLARNGPEVVRIGTAFRVKAPTVWHIWSVSLVNSYGGWNENFDGGPTNGTWDAEHEKNIRSSQGVTAEVTPGSYAVLATGAICHSGMPTAGS